LRNFRGFYVPLRFQRCASCGSTLLSWILRRGRTAQTRRQAALARPTRTTPAILLQSAGNLVDSRGTKEPALAGRYLCGLRPQASTMQSGAFAKCWAIRRRYPGTSKRCRAADTDSLPPVEEVQAPRIPGPNGNKKTREGWQPRPDRAAKQDTCSPGGHAVDSCRYRVSFSAVRAVSHPTSAAPRLRSIAVLPLENLSGDPHRNFSADGMTDELITDLAKVSALRVISRTSVMRYKGTKKVCRNCKGIERDGIVEGSVMRSGNRVRITAQLLQASTDQHLWAESYERDLGDILRLQSQVAQAIALQVRAQLTPQQQARFRSAGSVNPDAYEAYLRGRYYLSNSSRWRSR